MMSERRSVRVCSRCGVVIPDATNTCSEVCDAKRRRLRQREAAVRRRSKP